MLRRIAQLVLWSEDLVTPQCVWLPGLFNPTAYLTAVMQVSFLFSRCTHRTGGRSISPDVMKQVVKEICKLPPLFPLEEVRIPVVWNYSGASLCRS